MLWAVQLRLFKINIVETRRIKTEQRVKIFFVFFFACCFPRFFFFHETFLCVQMQNVQRKMACNGSGSVMAKDLAVTMLQPHKHSHLHWLIPLTLCIFHSLQSESEWKILIVFLCLLEMEKNKRKVTFVCTLASVVRDLKGFNHFDCWTKQDFVWILDQKLFFLFNDQSMRERCRSVETEIERNP